MGLRFHFLSSLVNLVSHREMGLRFYYLLGFLSLVLLIVLITCAEISIALTYFQLTSEARGVHGVCEAGRVDPG